MNKPIKLLAFLFALLVSQQTLGQTLYLRTIGSEVRLSKKVNGTDVDYTLDQMKNDIQVKKGLIIDKSGYTGASLKIFKVSAAGVPTEITADATELSTMANGYTYLGKDAATKILKIETVNSAATPVIFDNIGKDFLPPQVQQNTTNNTPIPTAKFVNWREFLSKSQGNAINIIKGSRRYFPSSDKAYICIDPYGNIIGRKPVNLDQDDEVIFLMIVPNDDRYDSYSVDDNDAEYAPSDLSFRPTDAITDVAKQSGEKPEDLPYTIKEFPMGPYTASNVTFNINSGSETLNSFTLHINPLYHLAIGASYVLSDLESPEYLVQPSASDASVNTINRINGGKRTFITFNVIWYWSSTFKYLQGDALTRGRDVLKEPNILSRINPTFGLALKGNLNENFFTGLTFEFARGGSIVGGWHYGKVSRLADPNFVTGQTVFSGVQADLKTQSIWKWGQFVGVTLDTRIFNRLFNRSTTGN